ncbi:serine/threonine protein kinase [Anaeromyxobacter sp. K]|uniref:Serine/threonine protein kinase n=1 Tax=Anaeromyxobacter dehalogenans (strain ATCC BAA-258 / DSM 21875 / 2CP-1) TaxID=455488 RepID=B8J901_ANAD2|nr:MULTISPECIES: serine/threonine-protein kinase [Anaeromyxobacter]ACG71471.1 serine/threonine protein kinase [Anaeromyxobacter sp. K]ACL63599.1 serine/threonine protein kinase [Anaeromyxobacter dehalogenans 2CP-1]
MVRKVGTSRIVREIGRGGMGVVYEAFQEGLERPVAVKALDQKLVRSSEVVERFRREGRAYAQLRHEAIVAVHDLVEKDDQLYLVTDLVDGADLARVLAQGGALPADCVAVIGARLAEALDYVHWSGLLHRDVKPANVMISRLGEVKLMDFGIAKGAEDPSLTRVGMLVGSPSYMAPEVLAGDEGGPAADVWALGVTLYELVCGEKPFRGANADELFRLVRRGRFRRVRSLAPGCPARVAAAIERCLARTPERRWKSAGALARHLDAFAAKKLARLHPRARLVALLANRGFATEEVALSRMDVATLNATRLADEKGTATVAEFPVRRRRRATALQAALALAAAAAVWLAPLTLP